MDIVSKVPARTLPMTRASGFREAQSSGYLSSIYSTSRPNQIYPSRVTLTISMLLGNIVDTAIFFSMFPGEQS